MKKEKVEKLLKLYFNGKSSVHEEKLLRHYFQSDNILPEFMKYRDLFNFFSSEAKLINSYRYKENKNKFILSFTAVAASFIAFLLIINNSEADKIRVVVGGEKMKDKEIALQIVDKQLSKINIMYDVADKNFNKLNSVSVFEKCFWFVDENGAIRKVPKLLDKLSGKYSE